MLLPSFLLFSYSPDTFPLLTSTSNWITTNCKFISLFRNREFENFLLNQRIKTYGNEIHDTEPSSLDLVPWYRIFSWCCFRDVTLRMFSVFKNDGTLVALQGNNSGLVWCWRYFPPKVGAVRRSQTAAKEQPIDNRGVPTAAVRATFKWGGSELHSS